METNVVLAKYMEACHSRNDHFRYNLALNAVLDWIGGTIKGASTIQFECDVF